MNFNVIQANNRNEWNRVLSQTDCYDFYHTPSYHQLDSTGDSRLLVFEKENECWALPLIFRKIPGTDWHDVTSVYGYAGWIKHAQTYPSEIFNHLEAYFQEEKIVSCFSRIHPFIEGADWFERGSVEEMNTTTAIDLKLLPESQWKSYSESVRRSILKSRRNGATVRLANSRSDIDQFVTIYRKAMSVLHASPHYYFSDAYFSELLKSSDFESFILLCEVEGEVAGGGLFIVCNQIMQYHLGATVEEYKSYSPLKLLLDEARQIGNQSNLSLLHLGGGHAGKNDDLYVFKSRISTLRFPFKVWKWIVNETVYEELSKQRKGFSFFPAYRA